MKIVCIGDSLTYGFGVNAGQNWVSLLERDSSAEFINRGANGDTTGGMLARFSQHVLKLKPGMAVIMGGSNDIISYGGIEKTKTNIIAMTGLAREHGVMPIVGVPLPMDVPNVAREWAMFFAVAPAEELNCRYALWLREFAEKEDIFLLDFRALFQAKADMAGLYFDGLHPNPIGHRLMAGLALQRLKRFCPSVFGLSQS